MDHIWHFLVEIGISSEEKERKLEDIYLTHDFSKFKVEDYEWIQLNWVIRNNKCPKLIFLREDGVSNMGIHAAITKTLKTRPTIRKGHYFEGVNKKTGYEVKMIKIWRVEEIKHSMTEQCDFWKACSGLVKSEFRNQRGR